MLKNLFTLVTAFLLLLLLSGCATFNLKSSVKTTNNISIQNTSDKKLYLNVDYTIVEEEYYNMFLSQVTKNLTNKGYILVHNKESADYNVRINILFAQDIKKANALLATQKGFTSGLSTGLQHAESFKQAAAVAVASALSMGMVAIGLEDKTYRSVVDVFINSKKSDLKTRIFAETIQLRLSHEEALSILMLITSEHIAKTIF